MKLINGVIAKGMFVAVMLMCGTGTSMAAEELLKPFVLASKGAGTVEQKAAEAKKALTSAGFTIAGEYSPYAGADVIVVTSDALKANAAQSERGGFGAIQRVAVTRVGNEIQVSYTNPVYMANVYRMKGDLQDVRTKLGAALGNMQDFGAQGMTAHDARRYHYMIGMEYFTDPSLLASYGSHDEAVQAVDRGLATGKGGVSKVYRVDVPGTQEVLFGVGMKAPTDAQKYMDDKFIMSEIDSGDIRSTAHLPYEVLVSGNNIYALYARFRIAIDFPDLSMMGKHSFMNIMKTPEAIRETLQQAVSP